MSPYLAAKMGIRYSFLFGLFLCNISVLSAYYIVYVDKILYPKQKYKYEILHQFSEPLLLAENDSDDDDENEHEHKNGHGKKVANEVISGNTRNKLKCLINDENQNENENEIQIKINDDENEVTEEGKEQNLPRKQGSRKQTGRGFQGTQRVSRPQRISSKSGREYGWKAIPLAGDR